MAVISVTEIDELIEQIFAEDIERLCEEDLELLRANREQVQGYVLPFVRREITRLSKEDPALDSTRLYWGLALLAFLEIPEAFDEFRNLCYCDEEIIDQALGDLFYARQLPAFLAATCCGRWKLLHSEIENASLDDRLRGACVEALVLLIGRGDLDRQLFLHYCKGLLCDMIYRGLDDEPLACWLVHACKELWPGESLEEIRELFGIGLVNESFVEMSEILEAFQAGKESCMRELQERIKAFHPLCPFLGEIPCCQSFDSDSLENAIQFAEQVYFCEEELSEGTSLLDSILEEKAISFDTALSPDFDKLPVEEKKKIEGLYELIFSSPQQALQEALQRIARFPDNPVLYSHLYIIYCEFNWKRESVALIKEFVKRFPNHLFGLVEYAKYLLRRGEPDKVAVLFRSCNTLQEFYPDRSCFNCAEWQLFAHVQALLNIELERLIPAKAYLEILERIDPEGEEVHEVEEKLRLSAVSKVLSKA